MAMAAKSYNWRTVLVPSTIASLSYIFQCDVQQNQAVEHVLHHRLAELCCAEGTRMGISFLTPSQQFLLLLPSAPARNRVTEIFWSQGFVCEKKKMKCFSYSQ